MSQIKTLVPEEDKTLMRGLLLRLLSPYKLASSESPRGLDPSLNPDSLLSSVAPIFPEYALCFATFMRFELYWKMYQFTSEGHKAFAVSPEGTIWEVVTIPEFGYLMIRQTPVIDHTLMLLNLLFSAANRVS